MICIIHSVSIDNEGEGTLVLKTPAQEVEELAQYMQHTKQIIGIKPDFTNLPEYKLHELK